MGRVTNYLHDRLNLPRISYVCLFIAAFLLTTHSVLSLFDRYYYDPNIANFKYCRLVQTEAKPGEVVHYKLRTDKFMPLVPRITRKLAPVTHPKDEVDIFPDITGSGQIGNIEYDRFFTVPYGTPLEYYHLMIYFHYPLGNGKEKTYVIESENTLRVTRP